MADHVFRAFSVKDFLPQVGTSGKIKSPKFRRGDFVKLLARELLLIGHDELKEFGGVISKEKLAKIKVIPVETINEVLEQALDWTGNEDILAMIKQA